MRISEASVSNVGPYLNFSVNGGYSLFGEWSECSALCDGGLQTRHRTCTDPAPAHGGLDCEGDSYEIRECNTVSCSGLILVLFRMQE